METNAEIYVKDWIRTIKSNAELLRRAKKLNKGMLKTIFDEGQPPEIGYVQLDMDATREMKEYIVYSTVDELMDVEDTKIKLLKELR